jgi:hypothetical protein
LTRPTHENGAFRLAERANAANAGGKVAPNYSQNDVLLAVGEYDGGGVPSQAKLGAASEMSPNSPGAALSFALGPPDQFDGCCGGSCYGAAVTLPRR